MTDERAPGRSVLPSEGGPPRKGTRGSSDENPSQAAMAGGQDQIEAYRDSPRLRFEPPGREADLVPFITRFARTIAADPARYATAPEDARALLEGAEAYEAAYRATRDRETTPPGEITQKMALRAHIVKAVRKRAQWIKVQPSISVEDKVRVGFARGCTSC